MASASRYHGCMRCLLALGLGAALAGIAGVSGCNGGSFPADDGGAEGGFEEGGTDSATSDSSFADAARSDGASADAGFACGQLGGTYTNVKACNTASDCTTIAKGCYCGAQPVIGISKSAAAAATACEMKASSQCALGCANSPGRVAEDGANDVDGGTIQVLCDANRCHSVLR